jgi:SpoIIAA-like
MINAQLLRDKGILVVSPADRLETTDFERLRLLADPYIEEHGDLNGLLIDAESFFGWEDFSGMLSNIRFLRNYHEKIERVAAVTDNGFLAILPSVADYFIAAEVRHFNYQDRDEALNWLSSGAGSER